MSPNPFGVDDHTFLLDLGRPAANCDHPSQGIFGQNTEYGGVPLKPKPNREEVKMNKATVQDLNIPVLVGVCNHPVVI